MPYLEDFTVGETARFGHYEVERDEVIAFAKTFDPQPFHLSDEAAAQTHFGRVAASGWHTCAMAMRMIVDEWYARDDIGTLGAPGVENLRWMKPVYPGDVLSCEAEILEVRASKSRPDMGLVKSRLAILNQNGETVMTQEPTVLYRRRLAA